MFPLLGKVLLTKFYETIRKTILVNNHGWYSQVWLQSEWWLKRPFHTTICYPLDCSNHVYGGSGMVAFFTGVLSSLTQIVLLSNTKCSPNSVRSDYTKLHCWYWYSEKSMWISLYLILRVWNETANTFKVFLPNRYGETFHVIVLHFHV
jgi:hypothetical protein